MNKYFSGLLILVIISVLGACGSDDNQSETENNTEFGVEITESEKVDDDQIVAVINGEDVTGKTYNLVYSQLKLHAGQFGEEVDIDEIKRATMESIIDRELLMQQASEEGIEITNEMATTEFETMKAENSETLDTLLAQYQITEEGFKEQLKFELTMNEYMAKTIDVSVTDEEVKEYYDEAKESNEEIPEFDEIKDQLKKQVLQQKTNDELQAKIDKVKEKAEIEEKI